MDVARLLHLRITHLDPLQSKALVQNAVVARAAVLVGAAESIASEEAENVESIV